MSIQRAPLMDISNTDMTSSPVASGGRRKSGRAVKIPQKFAPDAPSSQTGSAASKRKRTDEDVGEDASDIDEEVEASAEEVESAAEEEFQEARRKAKKSKAKPRKPAAKKPKVNGDALSHEPLAVRLPARPRKPAGKRVAIADKDAEGLYADVFTSGDATEDVVTRWLASYERDNLAALADLVNFVLRSSGCTIEVSSDDVGDDDNVQGKLEDIQAEHQANNISDYPLIARASKSSLAFRESLIDFFDKLIETMHATGIMYQEKPLIENIDVWLSALSSSGLRPFRHTATLIILTMTTAMCRVADGEIQVAAQVQRQLEAESKKKGANKARIADFQKRVKTNSDNKAFIEQRIASSFDVVYTHRYRDVDPKIRVECAEAMGTWMLTLPSVFFDGSYLRYMGWMLSDPNGSMRPEVVKQLRKLMENLNPGGMRHFIERFRPRIIEMAVRDAEPEVRAFAVGLVDSIRKAGMLEPDDIDTIGKLIFDSEPRVRNAIVDFFAENINDFYDSKVDELGGEEAIEKLLTVDEEDYDTPRADWIRLKCLVESLLSYDTQDQDEMPSQIAVDFLDVHGVDSRFSLAAQALYESIPVLQDWEVLAGYLLYDHTSADASSQIGNSVRESFKPGEQEERVLLEILNASVKIALLHLDEKMKRSSRSAVARAEIKEAKENTARRLAGLIPRLLKKYGADPRTVTPVLRLEHVLDLSVFQELRQDNTVYSQMLDEISAQFNGHADKGVLAEAAAAFLHARGHEELEEIAASKISSLWEDTANSLRKINKAGDVTARGRLQHRLLNDLSHVLGRLEQLSTISSSVEVLEEPSPKNSDPLPIVILLDIISRGVFEAPNDDEEIDSIEDEIVLSAIKSAMFYFMWKIRAISNALTAGDEVADMDIDNLKEWQTTFVNNVGSAFSSRSTLDAVRLAGAGALLDVHVLFTTLKSVTPKADDTEGDNQHYLTLVQHISPELQQELVMIFDSLEKLFAKKARKRLAEPSDDEEPEDVDDDPEDDEDDSTDSEHQAQTLSAEKELCEMTGKLVLAIVAKVIDDQGPHKGKLRSRLQRNKLRLGPNFKEVLAYLDEPKSKAGKKSHQSKAKQAAAEAKKAALSKEVVEEDEEDDDPFADAEPEEGSAEDLRRRELLEEEPEAGPEGNDGGGDAEEDEDEIMGD